MKRFLFSLLSAVLICNLIFTSQASAAVSPSRMLLRSVDRLDEEFLPETDSGTPAARTVYTTLSMGQEFLYQMTSYSGAAKALEIYKRFEAGTSMQGFDYSALARQINMTQTGTINNDINQSSGNVSYAISQLNSLFMSNMNCTLDSKAVDVYTNTIQTGFNVDSSFKRSFLIFTKRSGSSYTCLFKLLTGSLQNVNGNTILTLVPTELTVNVNIKVRKVLGITIKKKKHYDVHIKAYSYVYNLG